ncbi:MAG: pyridoxamine 5'-phosphate oxidase family protein [Myxococcota bacterium]
MDASEPHPDQQAAALAAERDQPAVNTRKWLLNTYSGTLCTLAIHREVDGFPFGSVVPFALDAQGRPFILTANIAAHTANLRRDPRASLMVQQPGIDGDPQAGWRITLMGRWAAVSSDDPELPHLHARYQQRVPKAERYLETHDFAFWRMEAIRKVRYIAGFGKICWFDGARLLASSDPALEASAPGAIEHMNDDHAHNLQEMCHGLYGIEPDHVEMTALHRDGFFVRTEAPSRTLFFPFTDDVGPGSVRPAVIDVLTRARRAANPSTPV